jgi:cytidylate kinase
MKKEIITIGGSPGSGKSSTANLVAKKLKFKHFSAGDAMRKIALKKNISLNKLSEQNEKNDSTDEIIDQLVKKAGEKNKIIIDSRLAFHWIPNSFKIYLDLPPSIAKNRIANNLKENTLRKKSENEHSVEEIYKNIVLRRKSEKIRYLKYYGVDHTKKNNYDLVIDTNKNNLEQVAEIILSEYKNWVKNY